MRERRETNMKERETHAAVCTKTENKKERRGRERRGEERRGEERRGEVVSGS